MKSSILNLLVFLPIVLLAAAARADTVDYSKLSPGNFIETGSIHGPLDVSPDGKFIVTTFRNSVSIWNTVSCTRNLQIEAHLGAVNFLKFSPDGKFLYTGGDKRDNLVCKWSLTTGRRLQTFQHTHQITAIALSGDGKYLATATMDHSGFIWTTSDGQQVQVLTDATFPITSLAFTPDSSQLYAGAAGRTIPFLAGMDMDPGERSNKGTFLSWNVADGTLSEKSDIPQATPAMEFSPDCKYLAVVLGTGVQGFPEEFYGTSLRIWQTPLQSHDAPFLPVSRTVSSGMTYFDQRTDTTDPTGPIRWSPDGHLIAFQDFLWTGAKNVFKLANPKQRNPSSHITFSADGHTLAYYAESAAQQDGGGERGTAGVQIAKAP